MLLLRSVPRLLSYDDECVETNRISSRTLLPIRNANRDGVFGLDTCVELLWLEAYMALVSRVFAQNPEVLRVQNSNVVSFTLRVCCH